MKDHYHNPVFTSKTTKAHFEPQELAREYQCYVIDTKSLGYH